MESHVQELKEFKKGRRKQWLDEEDICYFELTNHIVGAILELSDKLDKILNAMQKQAKLNHKVIGIVDELVK